MMFLCTLSVVVWLAVANSNAQLGEIDANGTRPSRERYIVPQEIRDRVPVDFAATMLRKSFLKYRSDKNILQSAPEVNERPKGLIVKRISSMKRLNGESKGNQNRHNGILGSRKRSNLDSSTEYKKPTGFQKNSFQAVTSTRKPMTALRRETIPKSNRFKKNRSRSRTSSTSRPNVSSNRKSANSFADIKKAINALPQQMVKVVRDDIDCIDDPTTQVHDSHGPPCAFSATWPGSGGNPWFWLNNVIPQNWELFYN